jgi:hypothetical protein
MITQHHISIHEKALKLLREIHAETLLLEYNVQSNKKQNSPYLKKVIQLKRERIKSMVNRYEFCCQQLLPNEVINNPILERYG